MQSETIWRCAGRNRTVNCLKDEMALPVSPLFSDLTEKGKYCMIRPYMVEPKAEEKSEVAVA